VNVLPLLGAVTAMDWVAGTTPTGVLNESEVGLTVKPPELEPPFRVTVNTAKSAELDGLAIVTWPVLPDAGIAFTFR